MNKKFENLENILKEMKSVLIAFSGGIDSSLLTKIAFDILKEKALAVTINSSLLTKKELNESRLIAEDIELNHLIIDVDIFKNKNIVKNNHNRCYYCKKEILKRLLKIAKEKNIPSVIDASNYDDLSDYRPGFKAAKELKIRHPFIEAKITKDDIRCYSKKIGLSIWNKPSSACLASRIPYNDKITSDKLRMIDAAEEFLKEKGFKNVRVRLHKNIARIEINKNEFNKIIKISDKLIKIYKEIGFNYTTLDLQGFKSGSMNLGVNKK